LRKVYIAAFGSGMGHAVRMAAVADALEEAGFQVAFSSSGEVTRWLRGRGNRCNDIPLVDVAYDETGAFSRRETLKRAPLLLSKLNAQVASELRNLSAYSPEVVLSDSMASTVVAARMLGVRSAVILNQLRLVSSPRTDEVASRFISGGSVVLGDLFWGMCESVLVPDLPPPYTISERNLWNAGASSARAKYVGFLTPRAGDGAAPLTEKLKRATKTKVFWQISGPPATRGLILAKAMAAAKALESKFLFVIAAGNPGGRTDPYPVPGGYLYEWCQAPGPHVDWCDAVVSRAGHVSISDYILRAKPALLVPIPSQAEQVGNALKAAKLGLAIKLEEEELDVPAVEEAIGALVGQRYAESARELSELARGYDACGAVVRSLAG